MWETTYGVRALKGAEARFVMAAAVRLADDLTFSIQLSREDTRIELGVPLFDPLTAEQKLMLVNYVTFHLLDPHSAPPELTAMLEATVAAIYQQAVAEVYGEIDDNSGDEGEFEDEDGDEEDEENGGISATELAFYGDQYDNRRLVKEAYEEVPEDMGTDTEMDMDIEPPDPEFCPPIQSNEHEEWADVIMSLRDRVLHDEDWALESLLVDLSPEHSGEMKQVLGISDDYFTAIPKEPTPEQIEKARKDIVKRHNDCEPTIDF